MKTFNLNVTMKANTREEAAARLHLFMQLGTYFSEYNIADLTGAFVYYRLFHYLGKLKEKDNNDSLRPRFKLKKRA